VVTMQSAAMNPKNEVACEASAHGAELHSAVAQVLMPPLLQTPRWFDRFAGRKPALQPVANLC